MTKVELLIIGAGGQIGSYFLLKLYSKERRLGVIDLPQPLKSLTTQELRIVNDIHYPQDDTVIPLGGIKENPMESAPGEVAAFSPDSLSQIKLAENAVIFVAVKAYDYPVVQDMIKKLVQPDTIITYLVNGLSPEEKALAGQKERGITNPLVRAVIMGGTDYEIQSGEKGLTRLVRSGISEIVIGSWLENRNPEYERILEKVKSLFFPQKLRVRAEYGNNFRKDSFDKTLANLINPLSALLGCTCGEVIDNPTLCSLITKMIEQGIAVGKELRLDLGDPQELVSSRLKMYHDAGHQHLSSMGRDALLSALKGTIFRHENENIGIALANKAVAADVSFLKKINSLLDQESTIYNRLQQYDPAEARNFLLRYWLLNRQGCGLSLDMNYIINQYPNLSKFLSRVKLEPYQESCLIDPMDFLAFMQDNLVKLKSQLPVAS
jgi:ketopantoate reductase